MVDLCTHAKRKKHGKTSAGQQRYRCCECGETCTDSTATLCGMRIGVDKAESIIRCLMEGMGVRAVARINGVSKNTVLDTLVLVGQRCKRFMEHKLRDVPVKDVQADELYSFVYCKERTRKKLSLPLANYGDQYCFVGMERHTKLVLAWHMGNREGEEGKVFIDKLADACWKQPFQITTDGWMSYKTLIPRAMPFAHFGMLIKVYNSEQDTIRYSPGKIMEIRKKPMYGRPSEDRMCTSHIERTNLTIRMQLRRFTRLTNGFSRKWENHDAAIGLFFCFYNFCQVHSAHGMTPAMAAGVTRHRWTVAELIDNTRDFSPPPPPTAAEKFLAAMPDEE